MARKLVVGFAVLALLTAFTVPAFAQGSAESSVRGNLSGTVVDSSGAVVTGAKVTISGPTGTKSDTTNPDGQFLFPLLSPGFYGVKVEKGSFKTADVKGIEVVTGKTSNVRVGMVAGQADGSCRSLGQRHHGRHHVHRGRSQPDRHLLSVGSRRSRRHRLVLCIAGRHCWRRHRRRPTRRSRAVPDLRTSTLQTA